MDINSDGSDCCFGGSIALFLQSLNIFKQNKFIDLMANIWFGFTYDLSF